MTDTKLTAAQIRRARKALGDVPYAGLLGIELEDLALRKRNARNASPQECSRKIMGSYMVVQSPP